MSRHVAVLMGGWSAEREVSLKSGAGVVKALEEAGYRVTPVDVPRDLDALLKLLTPRPDVAFNALHGRGGEDGCIQGVLEFMGIPYTHSGVMASAVAMDKDMTKRVLSTAGVRSPRGLIIERGSFAGGHPMPPPYVVKPVDEGSTVGLTFVRPGDPPLPADLGGDTLFKAGDRLLVEEYIAGRELTAGYMGDRPLAVTEIVFDGEIFDFTAKYVAGHARHVVPASLPPEITAEVLRLAEVVHKTLGCRGVTRSDFRYDASKPGFEGLYFLEVNNQPGMTPLSLVPEQAAHLGIPYRDLVSWMVENAAWQG
ncbi:MAG: D-alanine--D-alanine ligase [Rhodospirillaceae bacterium]